MTTRVFLMRGFDSLAFCMSQNRFLLISYLLCVTFKSRSIIIRGRVVKYRVMVISARRPREVCIDDRRTPQLYMMLFQVLSDSEVASPSGYLISQFSWY